jgi:hypothetical protein
VNVDHVTLCLRSWFGHPEAGVAERRYAAARGDDSYDPQSWRSGLRCWNLLDEGDGLVGRAYEPTTDTPSWVFTDEKGDRPIAPPLSTTRLRALMVEYRLKGGVDA